uniref:Zinc finger HIT domain-containing protein 3 n=1 Tax=Phallusia mammillata TaxID=59560 RepID=A0A6F9DYG7_9ASCI|nr:zinc finger HIT domain-containing protein 3-like [Phallusia mammillata]
MKTQDLCHICKAVIHKYKCPTCLSLYCSVACFKDHQTECTKKPTETEEKVLPQPESPDLEEDNLLTVEKLENLRTSKNLVQILKNPHLRTLIKALDEDENKRTMLDSLMHEPIFLEFADTCLSLVHPANKVDIGPSEIS